jgi:cobalt-zinc-cadmium efflux system outer membrane protein
MRSNQLAAATVAALLCCSASAEARAQQSITRDDAIQQALAHGPRLASARADTALASAQLLSARLLPDPALALSYSQSRPRYHAVVDLPFDFLGLRSTRSASAQAARRASLLRYQLARADVALDADTSYTRALVAIARSHLSSSSAGDAERLRAIAVQRRDAGDASELDVQLATVNAGEAASNAAADSLSVVSALLDLQAAMGMQGRSVTVTPADSLFPPPSVATLTDTIGGSAFLALPVAAATEQLNAAQLGLRLQRKSVLSPFGLNAGIETGGASDEGGILPTIGLTLPLPFINRNRGGVAEARAAVAIANAELNLARMESELELAQARRTHLAQQSRIQRDQLLIASANRVAAMSLTSYREGAAPLASAIEAQRTARDVLVRYVDDIAEAWITFARLKMLTQAATSQ